MLVGSSSSGLVGFRVVPLGFGLYHWVSGCITGDAILARSIEIWPNHDEISPDLVRSGLDLDEISPNLMGFQIILAGELQIPPVFVSFHWKSFEYRQRFLVLWSGRVARVLGEETRQPTQRVSGSVGGDLQPTSEWSVRVVFSSGVGRLLRLVGSPGWLDSPSFTLDWVAKSLIIMANCGEIIEYSDGSRHLSTIPLKNFQLFKIAESVINFCLKKISN